MNCLHCGKSVDREGGLCWACLGKQKKRDSGRYARRVAAGKCPKCCTAHDRSNGKDICESCLQKSKKYYHTRKKRRVGTGICPQCGRELTEGKKRCLVCRQRGLDCHKERRKKRLQNKQCLKCGSSDIVSGTKHCQQCKDYYIKRGRKLKDDVFAAYGGYRCNCCGETEVLFLQIDHVENDGAVHRREIGSGALYLWLKRHKFPEGFQVLCANCNWGKRQNGGICPHFGYT